MPALTAGHGAPFSAGADAGYILDCSVELGEITPLEAQVFHTNTPPARQLQQRMQQSAMLPPHWLRNTARQYLDNLPLENRYVWAILGSPGLSYGVGFMQEQIESITQLKIQADLGVTSRGSFEFLNVTESIYKDVMFASVHDVTPEKVHAFIEQHYGEAKSRVEEDVLLTQRAMEWASSSANLARAQAIARDIFQVKGQQQHLEPLTVNRASVSDRIPDKRRERSARSAIKKALRLLTKAGQEDNVRMLVSGQEVTISHPDSKFKFVLQPYQSGWLIQRTHTPGGHVPYQLALLTKDGEFLTRLCVLFDKTPVLDQLLALSMFIQSGNEMDILSQANWFGYKDVTKLRETLQGLEPSLVEKVPSAEKVATTDSALSYALAIDNDPLENHWAPFKGPVNSWISTWLDEVKAACSTVSTLQLTM